MRIFILSLSLVLALVHCQNYSCPEGKSRPEKIVLSPGDSFSFNTNYDNDAEYLPKTKCPVQYKASKKCKKGIRFSCSSFDIKNKDTRRCKKGDKLILGRKAFCGDDIPDPVTLKGKAAKKGLKVQFLSDKKIQGDGAQCTAECLDGAAATTTTEAPTTTSGVLITGGYVNGTIFDGIPSIILKSAEIYLPTSNYSCSLPDLPEPGRARHTQDGGLACGGGIMDGNTERSCIKFMNGAWTKSHTLDQSRFGHVSLATTSGVYLMGGLGSHPEELSDLVKEDGSVEKGFQLSHEIHFGCTIPDPKNKEVIIIFRDKVSIYSESGWQKDLPQLREERYNHACSSFVNEGHKHLIVTGGTSELSDMAEPLDSTEIYSCRDNIWTEAGKLPIKMIQMRAVNINNRVLLFGGDDGTQSNRNNILEYSHENKEWTEIGQMKEARRLHGVTVVNFDDYSQWCN